MLINCANCGLEYNIPNNAITDKPRKMRCATCKTVFTIAYREQDVPEGYEVIATHASAESSGLVYLKQLPNYEIIIDSQRPGARPEETVVGHYQPIVPVRRDPEEEKDTDPPPPPVEYPEDLPREASHPGGPSAWAEPSQPDLERPGQLDASTSDIHTRETAASGDGDITDVSLQDPDHQPSDGTPTGTQQQDPAPASSSVHEPPGTTERGVSPETAIDWESEQQPAGTTNAPIPQDPPPETDLAPSVTYQAPGFTDGNSTVPDIYANSAWETEAPLELESYAIQPLPSKRQLLGKLAFGIIVFSVLFFVFVAYRNNWSLSTSKLRSQIGIAFSGGRHENLPPEVKGLEVVVQDRRILPRNDQTPVLVVYGKVFNNSPVARTNVMLRGRLIDKKGKTRSQLRFPCNRVLTDAKIQRDKKGSITRYYKKNDSVLNCIIGGESNREFQLLVEDLPVDFNDSYEVLVEAISARYPG